MIQKRILAPLACAAALHAAPVVLNTYSTYGVVGGPGCPDQNSTLNGLAAPDSLQTASAASADCSARTVAQVNQTDYSLDFSITTDISHGANLWSFGQGGAYLDFTATQDLNFSVSGTSDASASAQYLIYSGAVYDLTLSQYVYGSEQISGSTASEHFDLGGNGGDIHVTDPWGNHEMTVIPAQYSLLAGHDYRIAGGVWNQTLAGYTPSWNIWNPGPGSSVSTWNFHLEAADAPAAVPEPASLGLMGIGLCLAGWRARRKKA